MEFRGNGAAYLRVSDDSQDIGRQRSSILKWLKENGLSVKPEYWFEDLGFARDRTDRPDFQRLLKLVELGKIQWIVIDHQDRFAARKPLEFFSYLWTLQQKGCLLLTVDGRLIVGEDDEDKETISLVQTTFDASKSQKEPKDASYRIIDKHAQMAAAGIWTGHTPSFGIDVACFPNEERREEKWRVVFLPHLGRNRRLKVYPDGRTERFDGEDNFPPTERKDILRQVASNDSKKLKAVQNVFKRYSEESISFTKLAGYLNGLGFRAGGGAFFHGRNIVHMLSNPVYIGRPAWNKSTLGKYHEYRDGKRLRVNRDGKTKIPHEREQWIRSETYSFKPIVPDAIWAKVQNKLDNRDKRNHVRQADQVLSGLVYCSICGQKMVAHKQRVSSTGEKIDEYFCSTYKEAKSAGIESSCLRNSILQRDLLPYVEAYLCRDWGRIDYNCRRARIWRFIAA